jgi:molybdopterin converting factor small subunit
VNIIIFGQLKELTGNEPVRLAGITDTNGLVKELNRKYPAMITAKYVIAVDKQIVSENTILTDNSTVALLPPFSGG